MLGVWSRRLVKSGMPQQASSGAGLEAREGIEAAGVGALGMGKAYSFRKLGGKIALITGS